VKFLECMIAYTPPGFDHRTGTGGKVEVGPWPDETGWSEVYSNTIGGCFSDVHELPSHQIAARVFIDFATITVRDGIDPQAAHQAFLAIDEYRNSIPRDMPGCEIPRPSAPYPNDTPTAALPLSVRARNGLLNPRENGRYDTVGKIRSASQSALLRLPNFGRKSLKEVRDLIDPPTAS